MWYTGKDYFRTAVAGAQVNKHDFPKIHFYDQDFVDIYNKTWSMLADFWIDPATSKESPSGCFLYPESGKCVIDQFESIFSSFFLTPQISLYKSFLINTSSTTNYLLLSILFSL